MKLVGPDLHRETEFEAVLRSLPQRALVDSDAQGEPVSRCLRQTRAALLHLASAEQRRIGAFENHQAAIVERFVDAATVSGGDPLDAVQTPRQRVAGMGIIVKR